MTTADRMKKEGFRHAGVCGVDAGSIWIGDPCYCVTPDAGEHPAETWGEFVNILAEEDFPNTKQFNYKRGHPGVGVYVSSGFGDGTYDVFVKEVDEGAWGKRVAEARIVFITDEEMEEDEA